MQGVQAGGQIVIKDGGHHAIKGFAFQFDTSLLEIFRNPEREVQIEGTQDFGIANYYTQVKNRNAKFSPSAVKGSIINLFRQHIDNPRYTFRLYCHFLDQVPGTTRSISESELNGLLGAQSSNYTMTQKIGFLNAFHIEFSPNYEEQFHELIRLIIKRRPGLSIPQARVRHAMYVAYLRDLILTKPPSDRRVTAAQLEEIANEARNILFAEGYSHYYGNESYIKLVRDHIRTTLKSVNTASRLRLFCLEALDDTEGAHLIDAIHVIKTKFSAKGHYYPLIAVRGLTNIPEFKRDLWESGIRFFDGSYFRHDDFRPDEFINKMPLDREVKIITESELSLLSPNTRIHHYLDFFRSTPAKSALQIKVGHEIHVQNALDIARILN